MAENKHYGRQIVVSLLLTIVILGAATYLFGIYLMPKYQISREQIYDFMVKVFPILIGLVMIEIGTMVAHRRDEDYADEVDKLPPNAYDKPLYKMPLDDQNVLNTQNMAAAVPAVPQPKQEAPKAEETLAVDEKKEEIITPEEAAVSPTVSIPASETIDTGFDSIFENELKSAQDMDYDLTLMIIKAPDDMREKINSKMSVLLDKASYPFALDDGSEAYIFPFYNQEEVETFVGPVEKEVVQDNPEIKWQKGFASRSGRVIGTDILLHEANVSCNATS